MPMLNPFRRQQTDTTKPSLRERIAAATGRRAARAAPPSAKPTAPALPFDDPEQVAWFTSCGLVPFPSAAPQGFLKAETAIRLEAGLLLERARVEFARQYSQKVEAYDDLVYRKHLAGRLERALRIPELEAVAREPLRTEGTVTFDASDADLVDMVAELARLDVAIETMLSGRNAPEPDRQPEYLRADGQRTVLLGIIAGTGAEGLAGLRAKARAVMGQSVQCSYEEQCRLAESLADDLLRVRPSAIMGRPDPIYAAISEGDRLLAAVEAAARLPLYEGSVDPRPEHLDALDALNDHRDNRLLGCVPETAAGCVALAAFAVRFARSQGVPLSREEGSSDLLEAMAECPAGLDAPLPGSLILGPDPVHAVIAESRRLASLNAAASDGPDGSVQGEASRQANNALFEHWRGSVLSTRPMTVAGCAALARYVADFLDEQGRDMDDPVEALRLIAASLAPEV